LGLWEPAEGLAGGAPRAGARAPAACTTARDTAGKQVPDCRCGPCITALRLASTWAELQQVVAYMAPSAIVADPAADWRGDPVQHLALFSDEWRLPVILYTPLTPQSTGVLLRLGAHRISHVIFHRLDDAPYRFVYAIDWDRSGPPLRAA